MTDTETTETPQHMRAKPARLAPAESIRRIHHYVCEGGRTTDEIMALVLKPDFWTPVGNQMQSLDRLEVVSDDMTFYTEFVVVRADSVSGVVLRPLVGIKLDGVGPRDTALRDRTGMVVEYRGPHLKWCVLRGEQVLRDKFQTEGDAYTWIKAQTKAQQL